MWSGQTLLPQASVACWAGHLVQESTSHHPGLHPSSNSVRLALLLVCLSRVGRDFSVPPDDFTEGPREESDSLEVTY